MKLHDDVIRVRAGSDGCFNPLARRENDEFKLLDLHF